MKVGHVVAIALTVVVCLSKQVSAQSSKYPGKWTEWSTWSACLRPDTGDCAAENTCCDEKKGSTRGARECKPAGKCNPKKESVRERACMLRCDNADSAEWTTWAAGECSVTCGVGTLKYTRTCDGTGDCDGDSEKTERCNAGSCAKYPGKWTQWSAFSACLRPDTGDCAAENTCCNEFKGAKRSTRECNPAGKCNPDKESVRERACLVRCTAEKYDKLTKWTTDKVCRRPDTGPCAAAQTCCKEKKGLKQYTRKCIGTNCDPNEPLERFKMCIIRCPKLIQCRDTDLRETKPFVERTCDKAFGAFSVVGTKCEYSCPKGFNVFPFDETTCAKVDGRSFKASWTPKRSPCCVAEECQTHQKLDLLFLLDTSLSIGKKQWQQLKQFMKTLVGGGQFVIGQDNVRVAVAQFNSKVLPSEQFLKDTTTKAALMDHIDSLECCGYGTHIGHAMGHMYQNHFGRDKGDRRGVPNILVTITDGATTDGVPKLIENTDKARTKASLYALKIGKPRGNPKRAAKVETTLSTIAGPDHPKNRLIIDSFDDLANVVQELAEALKESSCTACTKSDDRAEWSPWVKGECSAECGEGTVKYTRTCEGVGKCEGDQAEKEEACEDLPACAQWTEWEGQGCEEPCGEGKLQTFTRKCVGFGDCPGEPTKQEACEGNPACAEWTEWEEGECSVLCGKGVAKYTRTCEGWPKDGCEGEGEKEEECEKEPCSQCERPEDPYKGEHACKRRDGSVVPENELNPAGATCTLTCDEGLVPTTESITCGTESEWDAPDPCCKLEQCSVTDFMDLLIIVDKSKSNREKGWNAQINFLISFLSRSINIGPDNVRVGIIPFSGGVDKDMQINLKDTTNQADLLNDLRGMLGTTLGSGTFTANALKYGAEVMLTEENGDRELAPNLILVVTDGVPTEGKRELVKQGVTGAELEEKLLAPVLVEAATLRTKGTVFSVGVGIPKHDDFGRQTIREICGNDPNNHYFVNNHNTLTADAAKIEELVMTAGCGACFTPQE